MAREKPKNRHILRWILTAFGTLVLLVVVALILVALPPGEKIIRGILEDQLSSTLHQPVTIGRFETNVLSRLEIDSLVVRSDSANGSSALIRIDRIRARYRLWPLLSRKIAVDSLIVGPTEMNLVRDSSRGFNLALLDSLTAPATDSLPRDTSGSSYTFELGSAEIHNVSVTYADRVLDLSGFVRNISADVHGNENGEYGFELASDSGHVSYQDTVSGTITLLARGMYSATSLHLDTLAMQLERMRLSAEGLIPADSAAALSGALTLTGNPQTFVDIVRSEFVLAQVTIDSSVVLAGDLSGTRAAPSAALTLDLPAIRTYGVEIERTHLGAGWNGSDVTIDSLLLALFDGTVTGNGRAAFDTTVTSTLHLTLSSIDFAALWHGLYRNESPYSGTLGGALDLNTVGTDWHEWQAKLAIDARNARYRDLALRNLQIRASVDTGAVAATIAQEYFHISARGTIDEPDISGRLTMQVDRLGPLAGLFDVPDVTGSLDGTAELDGTIDNPTMRANITGHDITYRNFPVDTIALVASYADSVLTLTDLTAAGSRERLDSTGPMFGIDSLSGRLNYTANLQGRLDALTGSLDLHLLSPGFRGYRLDSARVTAQLDSGRVNLTAADLFRDSLFVTARGQFQLEKPHGTLDASAYDLTAAKADSVADSTAAVPSKESAPYRLVSNLESAFSLPDTGAFEISLRGQGIDLGALEDMLIDSLDVGGIASFDATLRGPADDISADLTLHVAQPHYEDVRLDSVATDLTFAHDTLDITALRAFGADQSLSGHALTVLDRDSTGAYTLNRTSRLRGQLDVEGFDLRALEPFLWQGGNLTGHSTIHLNWNGTLGDPHVRGSFALDSVTILPGPDLEPIKRVNLVSSIQDTVLTIDSASGNIQETPFALEGSATLSGGTGLQTDITLTFDTIGTISGRGLLSREKLDFTARIDSFNLALVQPFVTTVSDLKGRLSSRVELTGTADAPQINGRLDIDSLSANSDMVDQPITAGMLKATFTRTKITLDTAYAAIGNGVVSGYGYFTYVDSTIEDIDIRLKGRNVKLTPMPDFYVTVDSTSLSYTKPNEYFQLGGDIVLGETKYKVDLEPTAILPWTRRVEQTPPDFPEFVQQTRLSLRLRNSDNIWVDNNLAHIRLHAELEAIGSVERPNLSGQLSITEGYLLYLDRKFTVQDGVFYFNDPNKINPDLNLTATTSVNSYQALQATTYDITFSVTGTMEEPVVSLTSDPTLERADIISLLTLGATRQELAGGSGGASTGQILQNRAEVLASQQISGYVGHRVGNLLGLDEVSVQGNIFNSTDTTGPELVAAKQINDKLRVTYKTTVGHLNEQSVRVNYDIWRHLSLEGQTNRRGDASLNLKYGIRFR